MSNPIVAVIGRPNVGKSTLFNKLAGRKISIVDDEPGVTRDRIYAEVEWLNNYFTLIDTGGIEPKTDDLLLNYMKEQAQMAIDMADCIIFLTDVKQGLTDSDFGVADMLRKANKPIILVVNKVDNMQKENLDVYEFYNLGIGTPIPISASSSLGLGDMLDEVTEHFKDIEMVKYDEDTIKVSIIGKPNAGKSSLVNKILGEERVIVSEIPGTTRDAIDTFVTKNDTKYVFIDTAGIRRKSKIKEDIERYSILRAISAIERADVSILLIDAESKVTDQDTKIAGLAHEKGKGVIIAVNKWDKIEKNDKTMNQYLKEIDMQLAYLSYAPRIFISAKTGQRVENLYNKIIEVNENCCKRVSTGALNEVLVNALAMNQPPSDKGRRLKVFYATQVSVKPPTFVLFVNDKELMHFSYLRYIENQFRSAFNFDGTPVHFILREKNRKEQ